MAFEMLFDNCDDESERLFTTCMIDVKPKVDLNAAVNLAKKISVPFIVDVSDLPDNFDEDEGKMLFEKKVEERLKILWENTNRITLVRVFA